MSDHESAVVARWNAGADQFNQWSALGQDEKDALMAAEAKEKGAVPMSDHESAPGLTTDLDALRALAERATPGPWSCPDVWVETKDENAIAQCGNISWLGAPGVAANTRQQMKDNGAFIAACDPQTILAMIAELTQLRQRVRELQYKAKNV